MMVKEKIRKYLYILLILFIACIPAEVATRNGWLAPLENIYYDLWHQLKGKRHTPENVVIVAVDDQTLLAHQNEPLAFWGPHFAGAIKVLREAGVRCIGIDFLFSVSAESWLGQIQAESAISRTFDIAFREQLNSGNVIVIGTIVRDENNQSKLLLPVFDYLFSLPGAYSDIGLSNLIPDDDEVIRHFVPQLLKVSDEGGTAEVGLALAPLLAQRRLDGKKPEWSQADDKDFDRMTKGSLPIPIGYVGPPGTFPRISFERLLAPDAGENPAVQALKGKIAIIAMENSGTHDIHLTPYARKLSREGGRVMNGPEVHANIVETILTGWHPRPVSDGVRLIWLMAVVILGMFFFFRRPPLQGLGIFFILNLICGFLAYMLWEKHLLPVANINAALLISYIGAVGMRLTREEKARSQLQNAIGPYVSKAVVNHILDSGKLPNLGGETLPVTVLFSDIRSFTTLSELLMPYEVVEILNEYYTQVCEPILDQGGMIDKFIGDAVMAVFGAPARHPDHARRAILASIAMTEIARGFQGWLRKRFPDRQLPEFRIGIGLHTGEAVIGNIGSAKRMGYTAIGDTVNIASRLEGMSKRLGWVIVGSRETVRQSGLDLVIGGSESVQPTGRIGKIEVMEILSVKELLKSSIENHPQEVSASEGSTMKGESR
jgi:adenylate cyclase